MAERDSVLEQSGASGQTTDDTEMSEKTNTESDDAQSDNETTPRELAEGAGRVPDRVTVAGVPIRFENFTTPEDDATLGPVSFLSRPREWHAAGVGYIFTAVATLSLAMGVPLGAAISAVAGSGVVLGRAWERFSKSAHFRDALQEPAYAAFGSILGVLPAVGFLSTGHLAAFGGLLA